VRGSGVPAATRREKGNHAAMGAKRPPNPESRARDFLVSKGMNPTPKAIATRVTQEAGVDLQLEPERTLSRFRQVSGVLGVVSRGLLACAPVRMQPACDLD
jgi:hypothetical protein